MLEFKILYRDYRCPSSGDKIKKSTVVLNGVSLYQSQTSKYGLSKEELVDATEDFVKNLRSALSLSGVNSKVLRESV